MTDPGGTTPPPTGGPPPAAPPPATPGVTVAAGNYAEWWQRVVAWLIDWAILFVVNLIVGSVIGGAASVSVDQTTGTVSPGGMVALIGGNLVLLVIGIAYYVILNGNDRGQTVGKMVMKIAVRNEQTGGPAGYGKAAVRYLVGAVLFILCFIPGIVDILFPLWDEKKQTIHDKAAGTVVVVVG